MLLQTLFTNQKFSQFDKILKFYELNLIFLEYLPI